MLKVTTSWDDGDILDLRLADLLTKYGLKGTFYIAKNFRENRLQESDIKNLAKKHEIGAHTLNHPDLIDLPIEKIKEEIVGSKQWLEEVLGSKVKMFCYPRGKYNNTTISVTKETGFLGARTTNLNSIENTDDPYQMDTTLQVYPFPFRKLDSKKYYLSKLIQPFTQRASGLIGIGVSVLYMYSWLSTAEATFDVALKNGQTFHLWGHSWEIEKYGMWEDLEKFLQYISEKRACEHVTNSELLEIEN